MSELSKEALDVLERLRKHNEQRKQIPEAERHPITNPDKYVFPIGLDDHGKPFDDRDEEQHGKGSS